MRTPAYLPVSQKSTIWKINIYLCSLWHHSQPSQYLTMSQKSSIWKIDMYLCSLWHHVRTPESARVCVRACARQYFRPEPCHTPVSARRNHDCVVQCVPARRILREAGTKKTPTLGAHHLNVGSSLVRVLQFPFCANQFLPIRTLQYFNDY